MLMMEKISKAKYEYTDIPMGENQYANIDFENTLFVDAKYTHAMIPSDRGNRYIEALPPPRTEQEILQAYSKPILTYDFERESNLPDSTRLYMVGQLDCLCRFIKNWSSLSVWRWKSPIGTVTRLLMSRQS